MSHPRIDQVAALLAERLGGAIDGIERIRHGEWSRAFSFAHDGRGYVVRFSATDEDFLKDQRAMGYARPKLPIPRIVDMGQALGSFYAISERAVGTFLDALDADALRRALGSLLAALDAARQVDLEGTSGYGIWRGDGIAPHATWREALLAVAVDVPGSRTHGWRAALATSTFAESAFDSAFDRLKELVRVCPEERHLVHSDLLNYNVLVADQDVTAVLDWGSSVYGDFLFDLAWLTYWQPWYPAWHDVDFRLEAARHYAAIGLDVPNFEERLRCYEVFIGLDGMAYQAFRSRWTVLEETARRTLALA